MKLSIIIPVYNPPKKIFESTMNSVLTQGYDDLEIILVDDGSKSEIANLIDGYEKNFKKIIAIHQVNGGEGKARNTGLANSSGDYILFCDADDYLAPGWLSEGMKLAALYNADIVTGKMEQAPKHPTDNKNIINSNHVYFEKKDLNIVQRDIFLEKTEILPNMKYIDAGACAKIIKKSIIGNIRFYENYKLSTDQIFNHMIISKANSFVLSDHNSYYYLTNFNSISHQVNHEAVDLMMNAQEIISKYLIDESVIDSFLFHAIEDFQRAIHLSIFADDKKTYFCKRKELKADLNRPIVKKALDRINFNLYWSNHKKIRAIMLKYRMIDVYILSKYIYRKFKY